MLYIELLVTQKVLDKSFKKLKIKNKRKKEKSEKHRNMVFSICMLRLGVLRVLCCFVW